MTAGGLFMLVIVRLAVSATLFMVMISLGLWLGRVGFFDKDIVP